MGLISTTYLNSPVLPPFHHPPHPSPHPPTHPPTHHCHTHSQIALAATSLSGGYNARGKDEYDLLLTKKLKRRYQGRGLHSVNALRGAEYLLTSHMTYPYPRTAEEALREQDNTLSLSPTAIRALYAMQLELDTVLGVRVTAQCRLWAEERYKIRRSAMAMATGAGGEGVAFASGDGGAGSSSGSGSGNGSGSGSGSGGSDGAGRAQSTVTVYVAVLDVSGLRAAAGGGVSDVGGLMASKRVDAYVQMKVRLAGVGGVGGVVVGCEGVVRVEWVVQREL